jgi:hypothetical protein
LEEKKGNRMKCFGLRYTDDISFKNWLNRTPEQLGLWHPSEFQELLNFTDSSNLECFMNMEKEAINYQTSVLLISAHMFFENAEVKQKWQSILNEFAFKSGANKKAFKLQTTINKKREVEVSSPDADISMGFVEKFIEVIRLRTKISKISGEIKSKDWTTAWSFIWGAELFNRTVVYVNPLFQRLFTPIMEEKTKKDRTEGSKMILKSLKAQVGALLISMNQDYLTLMNVTLFNEVIYKFMDSSSSQCVVVALVRAGMVYGNKFLWELLIFKKLWFSAQEQNWTKQKVINEKRKLVNMQKPTEVQLDETISEKVSAEIGSTVPNEVQSILA